MTSVSKRKRSQSLFATSGPAKISGSCERKNEFAWYVLTSHILNHICEVTFRMDAFNSPICFDMMEEPHVTKCGHTYCFQCITQSLELQKSCPKCSSPVDMVFPNFLLNDLITRHRQELQNRKKEVSKQTAPGSLGRQMNQIRELLEQKSDELAITDLNYLILTLSRKKHNLEQVTTFFSRPLFQLSSIMHLCHADFGLCAERVVERVSGSGATP